MGLGFGLGLGSGRGLELPGDVAQAPYSTLTRYTRLMRMPRATLAEMLRQPTVVLQPNPTLTLNLTLTLTLNLNLSPTLTRRATR